MLRHSYGLWWTVVELVPGWTQPLKEIRGQTKIFLSGEEKSTGDDKIMAITQNHIFSLKGQ